MCRRKISKSRWENDVACLSGSAKVVELLMNNNCVDVTLLDQNGYTALQLAVINNICIVQQLIQAETIDLLLVNHNVQRP